MTNETANEECDERKDVDVKICMLIFSEKMLEKWNENGDKKKWNENGEKKKLNENGHRKHVVFATCFI